MKTQLTIQNNAKLLFPQSESGLIPVFYRLCNGLAAFCRHGWWAKSVILAIFHHGLQNNFIPPQNIS